MMPSKILYVSRSILPSRSGSSFITEKLVSNFTPEEIVVVGGKSIWSKPIKRSSDEPKFYYIASEIDIAGRGARFFKFIRWLLFPFFYFRMRKILKKEKCDYILCTYPDNYYLYLTYLLSKKFNIKYSTYFHNTYLENRKGFNRSFAEWLQPKIFNQSEYIYVMSKGMQDYYYQAYPHLKAKIIPLVHTFKELPEKENPDMNDKRVWKLVAVGNFNASNLDATKRFINTIAKDNRFSLSIYTPVPKLLLKSRGVDVDSIEYKGFIDDKILVQELRKYDICVLTHGFTGNYDTIEYKTIFPTRTIPLLLSCRPIIAHTPPDVFLTNFLKENKCAEIVDIKSKDAILDSLERLITNPSHSRELVDNGWETAQMFYGKNVAEFLKQKTNLN